MKTFTTPLQSTLAPDALTPDVDALELTQVLPERSDAAADKYALVLRAAFLSGNGFDGVDAYLDDLIERNAGLLATVRARKPGRSKS